MLSEIVLIMLLVGVFISLIIWKSDILRIIINEINRQAKESNRESLENQLKLNDQQLETKKDLILKSVNDMKAELRKGQEQTLNLETVVSLHKKETEKLQYETANLNKILSNNQLRGAFGQKDAENLLKMAGFVQGIHYTLQKQQSTGDRPDITFYLPNETKFNIDVKFPFKALQRYFETESSKHKKEYFNTFRSDIKDRLKGISTKDYINPGGNTLDFAIMYIPNEMIFSFIYEKFQEEYKDALKKKILMCGPNSFIAILKMIQQFYDNLKYQKNFSKIVEAVRGFEAEYNKFSNELDKLGKKIEDVSNVYHGVSGVRDRQLIKFIEKIKSTEEL